MGTVEMSQQIKALEGLLVDEQLQELEQRLGRFNIFDALAVSKRELQHSNFLSWLLDPYGTHGQGDLFLKAVLIDLLRQAPADRRPFSPVMIDGRELRGVEIKREWRNIDLLITCEDPPFVVAIENKVHSTEHSQQLDRYEKIVRETLKSPAMFVFLTIDGERASDDDWVPYSYADIHRVLQRTAKTAGQSLGTDVAAFLDHYLRLLKGRFMNDDEIERLCTQIYRNHKDALDLIMARANTQGSEGLELVKDSLTKSDRWVIRGTLGRYLIWVPKEWVGVFSDGDGRPLPTAPCDLYLEVEQYGETTQALSARLILGPPNDPARRAAMGEALKQPPYNLTTQRKKMTERWTRFNSHTLGNWEPGDTPPESIIAALGQWFASIEKTISAMPKV